MTNLLDRTEQLERMIKGNDAMMEGWRKMIRDDDDSEKKSIRHFRFMAAILAIGSALIVAAALRTGAGFMPTVQQLVPMFIAFTFLLIWRLESKQRKLWRDIASTCLALADNWKQASVDIMHCLKEALEDKCDQTQS